MQTSAPTAAPPLLAKLKTMFGLGTPLIAFFFIQNVVNLASVAMLGRLGNAALAGVGAASAIYGVVLALLFGFDTGVQAIASRITGAGREGRLGQVLADALAASVPVGALLGFAFWSLGPGALAAMLPDKAAVAAGSANMRAVAPSLLFFAATIPVNASWIGSGRPGIAFLVTLALAPVQILLTLVLVFGAGSVAAEGAAGAGAAISLTTLIGVVVQFALALRLRPGFLRTAPRPAGIAAIAAIGWPVSLQQSLSQFGLMIAFVIVARLGTGPTAVINVLVSLMAFPIQCATGLGVAAATLVGQSLGRGDVRDARRWGWSTAGAGVGLLAPLGLIAAIAPEPLLGFFLRDPATLALAIWPARLLGLTVGIDAVGRILGFAFRGAGATKIAAGVLFASQWLIQLPLMWWIGVTLRQGLMGMVEVQAGIAVVDAAVLAWLWRGGSWTRARIGGGTSPDIPAVPDGLARIAILGGAGAGKSTLARRIGEALGLPVVHLDRVIYGPGWTRLAVPVARERLAGMLAPGAWVVEGSYAELADLTLPRADLVIWLDQPAWLRLWRSWRKTRNHRGRPRADRPDGCDEGFDWTYALTVLRFGRWSPALEVRLTEAAGRPPVRLRGDRAVARFADRLSSPSR
jgi:MATE family multidrug resistance protein